MAVSQCVSVRLGSLPLVWILPLATYLITFMLTFGRQQRLLGLRRLWPELIALGAINLSCALVPAFPISSSGSRTAIADAGGSRTQWFSLMALLVVLLVLLVLHPLLASFPKAALGALVIHAALRLIDVEGFLCLFRFRWSEGCLALITCFGVLLTDILTGVLLGVGLSLADLMVRLLAHPSDAAAVIPRMTGHRRWADVTVSRPSPDQMVVVAAAPLCFANAEQFVDASVLIADEDVAAGQRHLWDQFRLIAEPAGAAAYAALLCGAYQPQRGERVGIIVCGANTELSKVPA